VAAILLFLDNFGTKTEKDIWAQLWLCFSVSSLFACLAFIGEIVPAFLLGAICVTFYFKKTCPLNLFCFLGGAMAFFWARLIRGFWGDDFYP